MSFAVPAAIPGMPVVSVLPGTHDQQVRADARELVDHVAPRSLAERGQGHHRGHADRHAEQRQGGAQPVAAEGAEGEAEEVGEGHPASPSGVEQIRHAHDLAAGQPADDVAVHQDDHPVGPLGHRRVVGDDHQRGPRLVHAVEEVEDLAAGGGVEVAGGLVGQEQARLHDRGAGQGHPLALAAGELVRPVVDAVREAHRRQRGLDPLPPLAARQAGEDHGQLHVLGRGQARHEVERLEDEADEMAADLRQLLVAQAGRPRGRPASRSRCRGGPGSRACRGGSTCRSPTGP